MVTSLPSSRFLGRQLQTPTRLKRKAKSLLEGDGLASISENGCMLATCDVKQPDSIAMSEVSTGATKLVQLPQQVKAVCQLWPCSDGRAIVMRSAKPGLPELWLWTCAAPSAMISGSFEKVCDCAPCLLTVPKHHIMSQDSDMIERHAC